MNYKRFISSKDFYRYKVQARDKKNTLKAYNSWDLKFFIGNYLWAFNVIEDYQSLMVDIIPVSY